MPKYKKHLEWLHDQLCILAPYDRCDGAIQVHHLLKPWFGCRGTGMKAGDENGVPLCEHHHRSIHEHGNEETVFKNWTGKEDFGRRLASRLCFHSPHIDSFTMMEKK